MKQTAQQHTGVSCCVRFPTSGTRCLPGRAANSSAAGMLLSWGSAERICWEPRVGVEPTPTHYECVALPLSYPGVAYWLQQTCRHSTEVTCDCSHLRCVGGPGRVRTCGLHGVNVLLYQLSYRTSLRSVVRCHAVARRGGFEPPFSGPKPAVLPLNDLRRDLCFDVSVGSGRRQVSNLRPPHYKCGALPTELHRRDFTNGARRTRRRTHWGGT